MEITLRYVSPGDLVVDATCGTGGDTAALAEAVGEHGRVIGFDIQQSAIDQTEGRLRELGLRNHELHQDPFEFMGDYVRDGSAAAVVFNLGYLPGGNHAVTTVAETTITGLEAALKVIQQGGVVTVVLYDGHDEGKIEKQAVLDWASELDAKIYHAAYVSFVNQANHPPEILWITKKK